MEQTNFKEKKLPKWTWPVIIILSVLLISSATYNVILLKKNKEYVSTFTDFSEAVNDFVKIYTNLLDCYKEGSPSCELKSERTGDSSTIIYGESPPNSGSNPLDGLFEE